MKHLPPHLPQTQSVSKTVNNFVSLRLAFTTQKIATHSTDIISAQLQTRFNLQIRMYDARDAARAAHTYSHTRTRSKNLFSRNFCTSREYGDYGYLKIKGMANTWSAISRLQIDVIERIQRSFQEYDFNFKISNWATRITCFTCSAFLLLTVSFLRIFYEIGNLKKNIVEVRICNFSGLYMKVASFCFNLLFFLFLWVVWFARYRASKFKMNFFLKVM